MAKQRGELPRTKTEGWEAKPKSHNYQLRPIAATISAGPRPIILKFRSFSLRRRCSRPRHRPAVGQLAWGQPVRRRRLPAVQEQVGELRKGRRGPVAKVGAPPSSVEASASCAATARRAHHCASSALPVASRGAPQQPRPGRACGGAKRWSRSSAPQPPPPAPRAARELSWRPRSRCVWSLSSSACASTEDNHEQAQRRPHEEHASVLCSAPLCSRLRIRMPAEAEAEPN